MRVPTRTLPDRPDLGQLRRQAKDLLDDFRQGDPAAVAEVTANLRDAERASFALHDAQFALARAYGYPSWPKLKAYVDAITVRRLVEAVQSGDIAAVKQLLRVRPELATMDLAEDDEQQALHAAVFARRADMVRLLMQHGADARKGVYPHRDATTAFTIATERGYHDIVAAIVGEEQKRAGVRRMGDERGVAIPPDVAEAARRNDQDAIIAFLEANPGFVYAHEYLLTPLHRAAMMLWDRVVVWLLEHGADVNTRIEGGPSPLEVIGCGFGPRHDFTDPRVRQVAVILRSHGAQLTPRAAVAHGELDEIRRLHAAGRLENRLAKNQGQRGLLEIAVLENQRESLRLLLDLGFDPDEPIPVGETAEAVRHGPLTMAVRTGRIDMAETLLARGATLTEWAAVLLGKSEWLRARHAAGTLRNEIGPEGGLVSMAVKHEQPDMLALLLELGLDPTERVREEHVDGSSYSRGGPLIHCAGHGKYAMAEMLLAHGADPNEPPGTALFHAFRERDTAMIELLTRHGARVTPETPGYLRDVERARQMLADDTSEKLAEEMLDGAATGGSLEILAMVLDRITWSRTDPRWHGVLRSTMVLWHEIPWIRRSDWALDRTTHAECLRLLLPRCDPNVRSRFGQTPLHEAAALGDWITDEEVVTFATLLLDAGATLHVRDDMLHSTPLGWACRWGRTALVRLLLARGADPYEPGAKPWAAPRAWAQKMGHSAVTALLDAAPYQTPG